MFDKDDPLYLRLFIVIFLIPLFISFGVMWLVIMGMVVHVVLMSFR